MAEKITKKLDRFFLAFLIINPFLDVLSGVYIKIIETMTEQSFGEVATPVTPSLIIRMGVLLLFALSALISFDKKAIGTALPVGIAWLMSVVGEVMFFYSFNLYGDIQYIARFAYNLAVILIYMAVFRRMGLSKEELIRRLNDILCFSLLLLSATIVVSFMFNMGYSTYADRYGYRGARGFFYSGNDITAILMVGLPVVMCAFMQLKDYTKKQYIFYDLSVALTSISLMLIGTKTAFLAVIASAAVMALCALWRLASKGHDKQAAVRFAVMALTCLIIFGFMSIFSETSIFGSIKESFMSPGLTMEKEGAATALLSGRQDKLAKAYGTFKDGGVYTYIFGVGRGTQVNIIEMDLFEVIIYYGIFGAIVMLWVYLKLGFGFVIGFFRNLKTLRADLMPLACLVSLGLCAGYLIIAGHVLFSVTSGFYFSFMLIYGKALLCESSGELKI